jgi:hypothetical protein
MRLVGCLAIEVKIDDECGRAAVMAHHVGQEAIQHVRVKSNLYHELV